MATYRIIVSYDGGSTFEPCSVSGYFVEEVAAHVAAESLQENNPNNIYEVESRKRGRPKGRKDSQKRTRRTKAQIAAAKVTIDTVGVPVIDETDPTVSHEVLTVEYCDATEDNVVPYQPTESEQDEMLREVYSDIAPDSKAA